MMASTLNARSGVIRLPSEGSHRMKCSSARSRLAAVPAPRPCSLGRWLAPVPRGGSSPARGTGRLHALADRPASTASTTRYDDTSFAQDGRKSNIVVKEIGSFAGDETVAERAAAEQRQRTKEKFEKKAADKKRQRFTYLGSAIAASSMIGGLAVWATYSRFALVSGESTDVVPEVFATLSLAAGAAFGMEMFARWAHRDVWHEGMWNLPEFGFGREAPWIKGHESHHIPREGAFEANDIFAIINAAPAIALILYGFLTPGILGGCCFGLGLGITAFGWAYMFVHDGLVHRRFPVGPIADVPYLKRVAAAHQLHHAEKFEGAPWGLFLAEQELAAIGPHAVEELDRLVEARDRAAEAEVSLH